MIPFPLNPYGSRWGLAATVFILVVDDRPYQDCSLLYIAPFPLYMGAGSGLAPLPLYPIAMGPNN